MNLKMILIFGILSLLLTFGCIGNRPANVALCDNVEQSSNKDTCFHRVAVVQNDPAICARIANQNTRDLCYMDLAEGNRWVTNPNAD